VQAVASSSRQQEATVSSTILGRNKVANCRSLPSIQSSGSIKHHQKKKIAEICILTNAISMYKQIRSTINQVKRYKKWRSRSINSTSFYRNTLQHAGLTN